MTQPNPRQLTVTKTLQLDADPERVWAAISDPAQLAMWFPDRVEIAAIEPGEKGWFVWNEHGRYAFEVVEVDVGRRLVWRWARDPEQTLEQTPTTLVEWHVRAAAGGGTTLRVHESGFETEHYRAGNDTGWDQELAELQALL